MDNYFSLTETKPEDRDAILALAGRLRMEPVNDWLKGKVVGLVFFAPSLRTLASFQAGVAQMGGSTFVVAPGTGSWGLETRDGVRMDGANQEHVREAFPVLSGYCDALGVRKFAEGKDMEVDLEDKVMRTIADLTKVPFVNMESSADHPCQALADWKTLDDLEIPKSGKFVLSWAYHPKALTYAVPRAALTMASLRGMDVTVLNPKGFDLPERMLKEAEQINPGKVHVSHDRKEAMEGAHVLYCKSWSSTMAYCDPDWHGHAAKGLEDWCVDEPWYETARPDAKFMHCLPVRRNVKASDEILEGPRSVVQLQANNRLHTQKALLARLLGVGA